MTGVVPQSVTAKTGSYLSLGISTHRDCSKEAIAICAVARGLV
jgi:hypothetical protein